MMPRLILTMTLRRATTVAALLLFSCALHACSDDGGSGGGGDTNNAPGNNAPGNNAPGNNAPNNTGNNDGGGASCASDDDCGDGEVCDTDANACRLACASDDDCSPNSRCADSGFCVARDACSGAGDCGDGELCNSCVGRCENSGDAPRACQNDTNCFIDEFCDPCRAICRPLGQACDPCQEDIECGGDDDLCLDFSLGGRFCGRTCDSLADCPRGFVCSEVADTQQCVPASGDCAAPAECLEDRDCELGQQCGPQGTCVPGCSPGTCPNGQVCDAGSCIPPCADDTDCPMGAECQDTGLCQVPGGCLTSRDCPDAGTYCDTDQLTCVPGCEADSDCPALQVCRGNQCQQRPCDGNYLCAFGQVCDFDSGRCVTAEGRFCEECNAEAENQCGGEPNQCLRISDDEGNPVGDYCGVGCNPDDPDACPVGYGCVEIQDQNMNVVGNVCFRDCSRDPI